MSNLTCNRQVFPSAMSCDLKCSYSSSYFIGSDCRKDFLLDYIAAVEKCIMLHYSFAHMPHYCNNMHHNAKLQLRHMTHYSNIRHNATLQLRHMPHYSNTSLPNAILWRRHMPRYSSPRHNATPQATLQQPQTSQCYTIATPTFYTKDTLPTTLHHSYSTML